jgi:DinB superfamily/Activator of Hsp90 ATPase homolog 1-like protein
MTPEAARSATVKRTLHVNVPIDFAFQTLTQKMGTWWPATHHIGKTPFAEIVVEPHAGGRWFERDAAGAECQWGKVLLWDPPKQLVVSWHLQGDFQYDPDMARASEVSFEFIAEGPEATRLEFEHRHIERHGDTWEKLFAGVNSPGGWTAVLGEFECLASGKRKTGALSQAERELGLAELRDSRDEFLKAVEGLTLAQWSFKPAAEQWSIAECTEHMGIIEEIAFRRMIEHALKAPAEPEKRKSLKYSDHAVLRLASERQKKLSAPERLQPTGRWKNPQESAQHLRELREQTIEFLEATQDDLRNHFVEHPAFGTLDTYQWLLLMGGHVRRHTDQIREIQANSRFPGE